MDLGFDVVVTITGIVLVFLILVLLMAIITLEGKIFDGLGKKKAAAKAAASKPAAPAKPADHRGLQRFCRRQDCCTGTCRKARCRSGTAGCACSSGRGGHPR